ncbi:MAG TPA: hypothetical protein VG099_22545 [Gemmataceae bacterium]|nr:hypothetical protein [Gemmataceae bacterium]
MGVWDGYRFLVVAENSGCFQPFALVDEGVMVEPFGKVGWDKHYGRRLEFGVSAQEAAESWPRKIAGLEPASQRDLTGYWMGSTYLPDGRRIEHTLALKCDGTYLHQACAERSKLKPEEQERRGMWLHEKDANLLIEKAHSADPESRDNLWRILEYSGSTMVLRWFGLASRNLPILFYRLQPGDVAPSSHESLPSS